MVVRFPLKPKHCWRVPRSLPGVILQVTRLVGDKTWVLASPIHAPSGSQLERFAAILGPLEAVSHILFWTDEAMGSSWGRREVPVWSKIGIVYVDFLLSSFRDLRYTVLLNHWI